MKVRPPQAWQAGTAGEVSGGFEGVIVRVTSPYRKKGEFYG